MRRPVRAVPVAKAVHIAEPMGRGAFLRGVGIAAVAGAAALCGVARAARAQKAPARSIEVWPTDSYQTIQAAIDNGGTVHFHLGTYTQLKSPTPSIPSTGKSFHIGRGMQDVDIVGEIGKNGERPIISGGNIPFRVQYKPIRFKIENMEIFQPDVAGGGPKNSRIGVFIYADEKTGPTFISGTVNNCKVTIDGDRNPPPGWNVYSIALWCPTYTPMTGSTLSITNNEVFANNILAGIGVGHFTHGPEAPPRTIIDGNKIHVSYLRGGVQPSFALGTHGNLSNLIMTRNIVTDDPRVPPGFVPGLRSVAIGFINSSKHHKTNYAVVARNDSAGFTGSYAQSFVDSDVENSNFSNNTYGFVDPSGMAGAYVLGNNCSFVNEQFIGDYPGKPTFPCFLLPEGSFGNVVHALKTNSALQGVNKCSQIIDVVYEETQGTQMPNPINELASCAHMPWRDLQALKDRIEADRQERANFLLDISPE